MVNVETRMAFYNGRKSMNDIIRRFVEDNQSKKKATRPKIRPSKYLKAISTSKLVLRIDYMKIPSDKFKISFDYAISIIHVIHTG